MRGMMALAGALGCAQGVAAQQVTLKPLLDARLRYEAVDQDGLPRDADAVTARVRSGIAATRGRWSALAEAEATLAIIGRYNDGLNGRAAYPIVADPQNIELNRAQLAYTVPGQVAITAGRQVVEIIDQRFVGSGAFRQNEQTFDAVRAEWTGIRNLRADVTYAWSVRTINGIDGRAARPQAVSGDNVFALLGYTTPVGTLTGFAYLVDQDEAAVQGFRLSSQTWGVRLAGARPLGREVRLGYVGSYARQSDYHRNPNNYRADYYLAEASLSRRAVTGTIGYEVLGADRGAALTSFQAPLSALFKFQGWADRFTTTPPDGVRDLYATAAAGWTTRGTVTGVNLSATWHRFTSDRDHRHYGDEWNLLAAAKLGRTTLSARYAHYDAARFATDTDKLWLTAEWVL